MFWLLMRTEKKWARSGAIVEDRQTHTHTHTHTSMNAHTHTHTYPSPCCSCLCQCFNLLIRLNIIFNLAVLVKFRGILSVFIPFFPHIIMTHKIFICVKKKKGAQELTFSCATVCKNNQSYEIKRENTGYIFKIKTHTHTSTPLSLNLLIQQEGLTHCHTTCL